MTLYRNYAYLLIPSLLCISVACSSQNSNVVSKKPDPSAPTNIEKMPSTIDPSTQMLALFEKKLCEDFYNAFTFAIEHHLIADPKNYQSYLATALQNWFENYIEKFPTKFHERDIAAKQDACSIFTTLNRKIYPLVVSHNDKYKDITFEEFSVHELNNFFNEALDTFDYFSYVVWGDNRKPSFELTKRSSPIPLLDRTDYQWRKPSALVVDPSYNGVFNPEITKWSLITEIDAYDFHDHSFEDTVGFLRYGVPEKGLSISFYKNDNSFAKDIQVESLQSEYENTSAVKSHIIDSNIIYIRIAEISEKTKDQIIADLYTALATIPNPQGLIIDFSGNVGGSVEFAQKIASIFLPYGSPLFRTETIHVENHQKQLKTELVKNSFPDARTIAPENIPPTIVITNRATASSGELVVSAWKANHVPIVHIGEETTFGKAIGQPLISNNGAILDFRLTDTRAFTFDIDENGAVTWYTWQLSQKNNQLGLIADISVTDPVIEDLYQHPDKRHFNRAFTMLDLQKRYGNAIEFSTPTTKFDEPVQILFPKEYQINPTILEALQRFAKSEISNIDSCSPDAIPGNPLFSERRECLYDISVHVMRYWISSL